MAVIRQFMGDVAVPDPIEMIRSSWYSNPFTRGSYSYDNTLAPQFPNARKDLGKPLIDAAGQPRVLFAGEATDPTHFSTRAITLEERQLYQLAPANLYMYKSLTD
ncbi:Spermine oxidase [Operophtera brumata]|uniref:Spermine oxidase n=1 Tax=Operophtera brumata TaxID=104452 RepID=A0A0L7K4M5_OPEBR|nr:Spermine oxidase [Operophtera brumata]